ncbi:MAG: hypothetical protein V3V08_04460 [Nannocystaceae bacterium]
MIHWRQRAAVLIIYMLFLGALLGLSQQHRPVDASVLLFLLLAVCSVAAESGVQAADDHVTSPQPLARLSCLALLAIHGLGLLAGSVPTPTERVLGAILMLGARFCGRRRFGNSVFALRPRLV